MIAELESASIADWDILLQLVQEFHQLEGVNLSEQQRATALKMLLDNAELGGIWLICCDTHIVGYIALCTSCSIEFSGKDAFIDEFYIRSNYRGRGFGKQVLIPILFNDEPYLTPPNLPLARGGAAGGGVNSMQHQIKSVLIRLSSWRKHREYRHCISKLSARISRLKDFTSVQILRLVNNTS